MSRVHVAKIHFLRLMHKFIAIFGGGEEVVLENVSHQDIVSNAFLDLGNWVVICSPSLKECFQSEACLLEGMY